MVEHSVWPQVPKLLQMSILKKQNLPESLEKLAAQRLLYARAKRTRNISMALIFLVALLGFAASVAEKQNLIQYVSFSILLIWFINQQFLKRREAGLKTEAATIQEDFDCFVFDLPWPSHKGLQRPTPDRIKQLAAETSGKPEVLEKLKNWYPPEAIHQNPGLSRVCCQRISCWWDVNLRRRWSTVLKWSFWIFVALVLFLSIVTGITVSKFIAVIASGIGVLGWSLGEINDQDEAVTRIDRVHRYISNLCEQEEISLDDIRSIQDEILEHRRLNPPVPDWFYWLGRERQESEMVK